MPHLPAAPRLPRPLPAAVTEAPPRTKDDGGIIVSMEGQPLLQLAAGHRAVPLLTPETHRVPFAAALRIIQPGAAPAQVMTNSLIVAVGEGGAAV